MRLFALYEEAAFPHFSDLCIGSLSVLFRPKQMLKVSWKPADDAGRSLIDYIVTTMAALDYNFSTSVKHPIISVPIKGLSQYSFGTVSVWAKNPGALSKPAKLKFRMVNIVTNGKHVIKFNHSTRYINIERQHVDVHA